MAQNTPKTYLGEAYWKASIRYFLDVLYHQITSIILVNALFLVTSIPVVTLPVALSAMLRVCGGIIRGETVTVSKDYFAYFKEACPRLLLWGLPLLAVQGLIAFAFWFYVGQGLVVPLSGVLLGLLVLWGTMIYWLPAMGEGQPEPLALLKKSALLAFVRTPQTLAVLLLTGALLLIQAMLLGFAVPLVLTLGAAVPGLLCAFAREGLPPLDDDDTTL